jgi:hypothetical protein
MLVHITIGLKKFQNNIEIFISPAVPKKKYTPKGVFWHIILRHSPNGRKFFEKVIFYFFTLASGIIGDKP